MRFRFFLALSVLALSASAVLVPVSANAIDGQGSGIAQPMSSAGLAAAEQMRLSVMTKRLEAWRTAMEVEQNELAKISNGGLLPPDALAIRTKSFQMMSARYQAETAALNADIAATTAALSKTAPSYASAPEVTGNNVTWIQTATGVYFAYPGQVWAYFDSDRPLADTTFREMSRASSFLILMDDRTNLRRAIDMPTRTVRVQQAPNSAKYDYVPIVDAGNEVDGRNVMQVSYPGGVFQQDRPGTWIERQRGRTVARFAELKRTRDMVQLADDSRRMYLFLGVDSGQISVSYYDRPGQTQNLYLIKAVASWFQKNGPVIDYVQ